MNGTHVGSKALGRRSVRGALTVSVAAVALMAAALPAHAQADDCKPAAAWTETIPAVGQQTVLVDNPDYKPARAAEYRTVHHDAVVTTTTTYLRYSWNPGGQVPADQTPDVTGSTPLNTPGDWNANTDNYEGAGHGTDPTNIAFYVANGQGNNGSWFYWRTFENSQTVPAWDEEVLVHAAVPAQGEPKIEKVNQSYKPASKVDHAAVTCTATKTTAKTGAKLAATGANVGTLALVAVAHTLVGAAVPVLTRRGLAAGRD